MLKEPKENKTVPENSASIIILLTDGDPNAGKANVLLLDVNFHYQENSVNSVTGSNFKQLFNGSEIVVAGRLNDLEMNDFPVEVHTQSLDDEFVLKGQASAQAWDTIFPDQDYISGDFTEHL
ncbi:hypothetical protein KOW79_017689 [Hemibagrus wyckioides]|uniref:Uncharacterized protein n=1 Tax=Hemibagrus wyckioides TaxID=337641 RepID=A0A9D3NDV2_9TELE|nr:hypothetical protein KOW79_017689 [Hemibagrus wyckioides]